MATAQSMAPQTGVPQPELRSEQRIKPDEFMKLRVENAELVDGKVVKRMPTMFDHDEIAAMISAALRAFVKQNRLGRVAAGGSFLTENDQIRVPDVAFASAESLEGEDTSSYIQKPPTLAVEIISKNDIYGDVDDKAAEFLRAGSKAVWIVNPRRRTVAVHTPDNTSVTYQIGDTIPGGDILPGFELPISDIFED